MVLGVEMASETKVLTRGDPRQESDAGVLTWQFCHGGVCLRVRARLGLCKGCSVDMALFPRVFNPRPRTYQGSVKD